MVTTRKFQTAPALIASAIFVIFVILYCLDARRWSDGLFLSWGVLPFSFPFLDADTIMSALRCVRQGIDVFETNPCDALGRLYDYSPIWLHAAVLPFTPAWIVPVGLGVDILFLLSLFLLPVARDWRCVAMVAAGLLSPAVAYALERANNDLIIFVLAVLAATLTARGPLARAVGYFCAFLAGLLKYFPMLLMALAFRERPRWFLTIAAVSILTLALVVVVEYEPLVRALRLIPTGAYFTDMFGARTLPNGLLHLTRFPPWLGRVGEIGLDLGAVAIGLFLATRGGIDADLARLTRREQNFLLAGAVLIIGCFVTAQNLGYRAIHLVLLLPPLTALTRVAPRRYLWIVTAGIVIVTLWAEGWRHWVDAALLGEPAWTEIRWSRPSPMQLVAWEMREACWWWIVTVLMGITISTIRRSTTGEFVLGWLTARMRPSRSAELG